MNENQQPDLFGVLLESSHRRFKQSVADDLVHVEPLPKACAYAQPVEDPVDKAESYLNDLLDRRRKLRSELVDVESKIVLIANLDNLGHHKVESKPVLVLPSLLPDKSDVDMNCREHLDPQAEQIIEMFKALTSPEQPLVKSRDLKQHIQFHYEIPEPSYWCSRSGPNEPERWWKNIYDKGVERLDLVLHQIVRGSATGKKGTYALKEYFEAWRKRSDE